MAKIVHYKQKGSKVWLSSFKIGLAKTNKQAEATAKKLFVNNWKGKRADAIKMRKKMIFKAH